MITKASKEETDFRIHPRVQERRSVNWQVLNDGGAQGKARVHNISQSGMLIETPSNFKPQDDYIFAFDADLGHDNFIPEHGRLVWHQKKSNRINSRRLCGVQFVDPSDFIQERLHNRIKEYETEKPVNKYLHRSLEGGLVLIIIGLLGVSFWFAQDIYTNLQAANAQLKNTSDTQVLLTQSYQMQFLGSQMEVAMLIDERAALSQELVTSKRLYQENQGILAGLQTELTTTKELLQQTENMLTQAKADNAKLSELTELTEAELAKQRADFENSIALLEEKHLQLTNDMTELNEQLRFYEGDVNSINEADKWFSTYKDRVKQVKKKIKFFRRQAKDVRVAAQKERDRIQMILGNNGYFMKNGQVVTVDEEQYNKAELNTASSQAKPKVKIDVDFFK